MPDNILKIKNKNLREEFLNHPIYSDKNDLDFYKENKENYDNKPYFVLSGPSIAAGAPSVYGYQELEYPRIGFYTLMPGKNPNPKHKYLESYYGKPTLYRWTKGEGFLNSKHYPEVTSPGDDNYPRIVNEFVTLSNMAGVPTFAGQSPEISKQLNELVVTPKYKYFIIKNKNGGTMRRLIQKYQNGNGISWSDVGDAASYMIPVYGTYRSVKDAINDPSLTNWGLAGLSFLGDLGYAAGFGAALKGIKASSSAAKAYLGVAKNYERLAADIAKEASKINPKSSAKALKRANNLADDAIGTWKTALDYRAIAAKEKQGITKAIGDAIKIDAGSTAAFKGPKSISRASELDKNKRKSSTLKKTLKKATSSKGDLVKKRTEPFLYNTFLKKDGGRVKLIHKH